MAATGTVTGLRETASQRKRGRKKRFLEFLDEGMTIKGALARESVSVTYNAYRRWRADDTQFAVLVDQKRHRFVNDIERGWEGDHRAFGERYFGMSYANFHLEYLRHIDLMIPGDMLLVLWPPAHGKTTVTENYISEKLALDPSHRVTVASENKVIAGKILRRVRDRMEPDSPNHLYLTDYGPFKLPAGSSGQRQPWNNDYFDVWRKRESGERDYSMQAIGRTSSIVSTRCDHLHIDDLQSTKTIGLTEIVADWLRQDALSRPGEDGITTIVGTRVGPSDIYRHLLDDPELLDSGIMKVIRFPAIRKDLEDNDIPLWGEKYNLGDYDRMRIKAGPEAWARNYMQEDGDSKAAKAFTNERLDKVKNELFSLGHQVDVGSKHLLVLDPALGGYNSIMALETTNEGKLIVRRIRERTGLASNEEIMDELVHVIRTIHDRGQVTDLIIEANNFQKGLANDERLRDLCEYYDINCIPHVTGSNKPNPDIGVSSMATSIGRGDIIFPWAADDETRKEIGELIRQLVAWKPGISGKSQRMDRVMTLWFGYLTWIERRKRAAKTKTDTPRIRRNGASWSPARSGLLVPHREARRIA